MRLRHIASATLGLALLLATTPAPAAADCGEPCGELVTRGANVQVEILIEGRQSVFYRDGPFRWIEGGRGQRFSFRVTNRNSFPVGIIPSADGQSLTADGRASSSNPAYVIDPHGSMTISVWREDLNGGRELMFTEVERSLAARKGDRRNVGVLGVLVWQLADRRPDPPVKITPREQSRDERGGAKRKSEAQPETPSAGEASEDRAAGRIAGGGDIAPYKEPGIGVGTGSRVTDQAYLTDRYRRVRVLDAIAIYYDDRYGLERAGVDLNQYRGRYPDRRASNPFPDGGYRGVKIP